MNIVVNNDFERKLISNLGFSIEKEIFKSKSDFSILKLKTQNHLTKDALSGIMRLLGNIPNIAHVSNYYKANERYSIGTSNYFYIKLNKEKDVLLLKKFAKKKGCSVIKKNKFMPLWYKLKINDRSFGTTTKITNEFYESGFFADVDPAFMFEFKPNCTNDPDFNSLWGLQNSTDPNIDINACDAWTITEGNNVNVAVLDRGIYKEHNDLDANISSLSYDTQSGTSPSIFTVGGTHGTHVAGTIAAEKDNNLQVVGVAPQSKLMSVSHSLSITPNVSEELADGINWAWQNGADVINNSWGDQGGIWYSTLQSTMLEDAIVAAMTLGRDGKGTLVVFAAGNHSPAIDYPASFHDDIIVVGSITSNGSRSAFSGYGSKLDIVAPGSSILSTLPTQGTGYSSGTSMAAPHVTGLVALILSVNPCLLMSDVTTIIETTSQKIGGYSYSTNSNRPNGTWNNEMGYGLIDAYAAVQLAQSYPCNFICPCTAANTLNVDAGSGTDITNTAILANSTYSNGVYTYNKPCIAISGKLQINNNTKIYFYNTEMKMQPDSKIEVQYGSQIKLGYSNVHGCDEMWDGIEFKNNSELFMFLTTISDAKKAISASEYNGSVKWHLYNNQFVNNKVGVNVSGGYWGNMTIVPFYPSSFTKNTFYVTSLLPPYDTGSPKTYGIKMSSGNMSIGWNSGSNYYRNEFKNLWRGVSLNKSTFHDSKSKYHQGLNDQQWVYMNNNSTGDFNRINMQTSTNAYNWGFGYRASSLKLTNSTVNMPAKNVSAHQMGNHLQTIKNSTLTSKNCIYFADSDFIGAQIAGNNFSSSIPGNHQIMFIYGGGYNTPSSTVRSIRNNTFNMNHELNDGISLSSSNRWTIDGASQNFWFNNINRNSDNRVGISLSNSKNNFIRDNTFDANDNNSVTSSENTVGIRMWGGCNNTKLCCNYTNQIEGGVEIYYTSLGVKLRHHDFGNHKIGLYYHSSAVTGSQVNAGNHWTGSYGGKAAVHYGSGSIVNQSKFYETVGNHPPTIYTPNAGTITWWNNGGTSSCVSDNTCAPYFLVAVSQNDKIIAEGGYENHEFGEEVNWEMEKTLVEKLKLNPKLKNDELMSDFYSRKKESEIDQLVDVDLMIADLFKIDEVTQKSLDENQSEIDDLSNRIDNISSRFESVKTLKDSLDLSEQLGEVFLKRSALEYNIYKTHHEMDSVRQLEADFVVKMNDMVETKTVFGANEKLMNDLYLQIVVQGDDKAINSRNFDLVKKIAEQCIYDAGPAVYKARSLYQNWKERDFDQEEICGKDGKIFSQKSERKSKISTVSIYPNPSSEFISITIPSEGKWSMIITNISGKVVMDKVNLHFGQNRMDTSILTDGVYFCKFRKDGVEMESKKLVIIH